MCGLALGSLGILLLLQAPVAGAQRSVAQAEKTARQALDETAVHGFDPSMKYEGQEVITDPVAGSEKEVRYTIAGPGEGVKSSVEYRIYDSPAAALAHAQPGAAQQVEEAAEFDMPRGSFRAYHTNLQGSALAHDVPQTFHCMALKGKPQWSRCYYYEGGGSNIVVVGTTSSEAPNQAIMVTAMGAQTLAQMR